MKITIGQAQYWALSDEGKITVGLKNFSYLPQYKLSGPITQLCYKLGSLY